MRVILISSYGFCEYDSFSFLKHLKYVHAINNLGYRFRTKKQHLQNENYLTTFLQQRCNMFLNIRITKNSYL